MKTDIMNIHTPRSPFDWLVSAINTGKCRFTTTMPSHVQCRYERRSHTSTITYQLDCTTPVTVAKTLSYFD